MPGQHSLHDVVGATPGLAPAIPTGNGVFTTGVIDTRDTDAVTFLAQYGAIVTGAATFTPAVLAGDAVDNVNAPTVITDEAAADVACVLGSLAAGTGTAVSNTVRKVTYRPAKGNGKRFVRFTLTVAGNAAAAPLAVQVVRRPYLQPAP